MQSLNLIGTSYRQILKPILFKFDPEQVHDKMTVIGQFLGKSRLTKSLTRGVFAFEDPRLVQSVAGVQFNNPVGLSAGFDKNAKLINILPAVGFGYMEIGSVTLGAYEGNPSPRLTRLPQSKALVVYYGLMNDGVKRILPRIRLSDPTPAKVGISIAKTNSEETASTEGGIEDYYQCLRFVERENIGDYYTINISCPNTFGGEPFTTPEKLESLLKRLSEVKATKPMFIKMPINQPFTEFDKLLKICIKYKVDGVVIGNLTKVRDPNLIKDQLTDELKGGISGKPTWDLSNHLISKTYEKYGDKLVIIGVGGIFSAEDAYEKIKRGATLLQLITGMIFQGPQLIGEINKGLVRLLEQDGYENIQQAIGAYHRQS